MGKSNNINDRVIISRINRIIGQAKSLEKLVIEGDSEKVLSMMGAVRSATTSAMLAYVELIISQTADEKTKQKVLARLAKILG